MPKEIDKKTYWLSCSTGMVFSLMLASGMAWSMYTIADENKDSRMILFWLASVVGAIAFFFFVAASFIWGRYKLLILHSFLFVLACVCALTTVILLYPENAEYIRTVAIYLSVGCGMSLVILGIVIYQFYETDEQQKQTTEAKEDKAKTFKGDLSRREKV